MTDFGASETYQREDAWAALEVIRKGSGGFIDRVLDAPNGEVPIFNFMTGGYSRTARYNPDSWTGFSWSGFLAGRLWLLHDLFPDDGFGEAAHVLATRFAESLSLRPPKFSAAGIDLFYGICLGARLTRDPELIEAGLKAVRQYSQNFDERFGIFFQIVGVNRAVIDTGLNLLPFYWAAEYEAELLDFAVRHNRAILEAGILREDGSTFQALEYDFDQGAVRRAFTLQGWSDSSTWARGQAWAIHNYTNVYEATGHADFRDAAVRAARWYVENLPESGIPFYDFFDPEIPNVPMDSCSAVISLNGLLRLSRLVEGASVWADPAATRSVESVLRDFLSPGGILLHGSWGRLPADKATGGISRFPMEDVMPYGNYWVVEALWRRVREDWSLLSFAPKRAVTPVAGND
jgi:unsaturated chondroitin disaccharide hydrolase